MTTNRLALAAAAFVAVATLSSGPARAETYHTCAGFIDTLPAVITTQGTWCLRHDVATTVSAGKAITISTSNVTIDCNGFKIGGLAGGAGSTAIGIFTDDYFNATVRNCTIRGFAQGISLTGDGAGHVVEANRVEGSRVAGIEVHGDGSVIRGNLVFDAGGSLNQSLAFGVAALAAVDVRDNIIDGVFTDASYANGTVTGLYLVNNDRGAIVGNRIGGLVSTGTGVARGIVNQGSQYVTLSDNVVVGDGRAGGTGIACASSQGLAKDNVVMNFPTQVAACTDVDTTP
jgi:hypothetical protein